MEIVKADKKFLLTLYRWMDDDKYYKSMGGDIKDHKRSRFLFAENMMADDNIDVFKIMTKNKCIGIVRVDLYERGNFFHLFVIPEKQSKGYAYFIVKELIKTYEGVKLYAYFKSLRLFKHAKQLPFMKFMYKKNNYFFMECI